MEYHLVFGIPALLVGLILLWRKSEAYDALIALLANPLKGLPEKLQLREMEFYHSFPREMLSRQPKLSLIYF